MYYLGFQTCYTSKIIDNLILMTMYLIHTVRVHKYIAVPVLLTQILITHLVVMSSTQHYQTEYGVSLVRFKAIAAPGAIQQPQNMACSTRESRSLASCAVQCIGSPTDCLLFFVDQSQCFLCTIKLQVVPSEPLKTPAYFLDKKALLGKLIT